MSLPCGTGPGECVFLARHPDLDSASGHLRVLFLPHKIQLRRPDVAVPRKLPHLVHLSPVSNGVVDGRLAERVNADPSAVDPVGIDACDAAILCRLPDYAE